MADYTANQAGTTIEVDLTPWVFGEASVPEWGQLWPRGDYSGS